MSNTKALDRFVKDHHPLCRRNRKGCWNATCNCERDQAAAELKKLHEELGLLHDAALRQEQDKHQLRTALKEAVELAEEGWSYASPYFQNKWGFAERIAKLKAHLLEEPK